MKKNYKSICHANVFSRNELLEAISNEDDLDLKIALIEFDQQLCKDFGDWWIKGDLWAIGENDWVDYAYDQMQSIYSIPKELEGYIDIEKFANDLSYDYSYVTIDCYGFYIPNY